MISHDTPIVILHGLGNRAWTLIGIELYLNWYGYTDVFRPQYDANMLPDQACENLTEILLRRFNGDSNRSFVVIGNSMGGVMAMNLHRFGWKIELAIAINSPLNGSTLLLELDQMLSAKVMDVCGGNTTMYQYLKRLLLHDIPPHPYKTIGTNLPFLKLDGMVYEKDAMIEPAHHHAIAWGSHHTTPFDIRVYSEILSILSL